jgi:hypothetical protein
MLSRRGHKTTWSPLFIRLKVDGRASSNIQHRAEHDALPAFPHFILPVGLNCSFANGSVDKPAQVPDPELPCRALAPSFHGALLDFPARPIQGCRGTLARNQEKDLPFHMGRHRSPSLLITAHRFHRGAEKLSHLLLRLIQLRAKSQKLLAVHGNHAFGCL